MAGPFTSRAHCGSIPAFVAAYKHARRAPPTNPRVSPRMKRLLKFAAYTLLLLLAVPVLGLLGMWATYKLSLIHI